MAWTNKQQLAIDTRDRTLLVSAAAGSGKTATLTERIIRSILDEDNPADIGRMLIATYTNAAVDELRERIGKAIKKAASEHPENARLEEQLLRLKDAKILTITSFCNSILRSSAESIGLSPTYRIAEPAEAKILATDVLERLINQAYEGELTDVCTADEFILLADSLSNIRHTDALGKNIEVVFEKLKSCEAGIDTLLPLIGEYDPEKFESVDKTHYGAYAVRLVKEAFTEYRAAYEDLISLASPENLDVKNLPKAYDDLAYITRCRDSKDYKELKESIGLYSSQRLHRSAKEEPTDFYQRFRTLRAYLGEDIKKFSTSFLHYSEEEWKEMYAKLYNLLGIFYRFLKKYYEVFMSEKLKRSICEFSDVERYAYESLYDKDGNPSELARELSGKFDAIYVDEYQDVNSLQNKIFEAIAKENNRFMVGDIKQSIYGFRAARPDIFAHMKDSFPLMGSGADYPSASIFMSDNFRCDETVIDFVNGIFDKYFSLFAKNIGYVSEDRLNFAKLYPEGSKKTEVPPEIHIVEKLPSATPDTSTDEALDDSVTKEEVDNAHIQARHIAKKIKELMASSTLSSGKAVEPKDIAILMRSTKGPSAEALVDELRGIGVATSVTENGDLFMNKEVLLALSFLYSIDNPRKDIYLVALMCSPLFGFTHDEVLKIRKSSDEQYIWDALLEYIGKHPEYERGTRFAASLLRYRRLAEGQSTDALLSLIYRESGLLALASRNGGGDNLILLHSYARKYERSDFKGLYSFISYVNSLIERGEQFGDAEASPETNAVRIMTIHKSKGLEFPVTFIADANSGGRSKNTARILLSDTFGVAMKFKDDSGLALVDNPPRQLLSHFIDSQEYEEELRVLYVALTRAREQLYIYGTVCAGGAEDYIAETDELRAMLSPFFATKATTLLDIIMTGRTIGKVIVDLPGEVSYEPKEEESADAKETTESEDEQEPADSDPITEDEYYGRFSYVYPHRELETLPEKISVSRLTPDILDGSADTEVSLEDLLLSEGIGASPDSSADEDEDENEKKTTLPAFMQGEMVNDSRERGIATHTVLQFCDLEKLEESVTEELDRLERLEFISKEDKDRVRVRELERFVASPLFREMKEAKKLYRELRFNIKLPAELFTEDEQKRGALIGTEVLVQGVIDCLIENPDGSLHLIDYKTDRLTKEERENLPKAHERLRRAHSLQLSYYKLAIEKMFHRHPQKTGIYSLHLGEEISV